MNDELINKRINENPESIIAFAYMGISVLMLSMNGFITKILFVHQTDLFVVIYFRAVTMFILSSIYSFIFMVNTFDIKNNYCKFLATRISVGFLGQCLQCLATKFLPVFDNSVLMFTSTLITALIARIFIKEKLSNLDIVNIFCGFIGVFVFSLSYSSSGHRNLYQYLFLIFPLSAAITYSTNMVVVRHVGLNFHWMITPCYVGISQSIGISIPMLFLSNFSMNLDLFKALLLIANGLTSWLSVSFLAKAVQIEKAGKMAILSYLQIVIMFFIDLYYFGSSINSYKIVGCVLIIACNLIAAIQSLKR